MMQLLCAWWKCGLGAIAFYTVLPVPQGLAPSFQYVSRLAPAVGLLIGGILWLLDAGLELMNVPALTASAVLVVMWILITGGLHLDGAMDAADGLAVMNPERRLEVMADSRTGAFGVMMAVSIVILKIVALSDLSLSRGWAIVLAASWGRWGQQVAIARYPYLKPTGKGAFHKHALPSMWACLPSLGVLLGLHVLWMMSEPTLTVPIGALFLVGGAIAIATGYWFDSKLGGHTGDTYGAVVEMSETLVLLCLVGLHRYL
ncbi:MAG: adenosylcobinamide-GDP ribazoletransferase [Leptolyngbyaceae bacterium]|nr:adenosylcobinamide-GDP ribazoletransferase [Leptolyngbyaceae bacterium]